MISDAVSRRTLWNSKKKSQISRTLFQWLLNLFTMAFVAVLTFVSFGVCSALPLRRVDGWTQEDCVFTSPAGREWDFTESVEPSDLLIPGDASRGFIFYVSTIHPLGYMHRLRV